MNVIQSGMDNTPVDTKKLGKVKTTSKTTKKDGVKTHPTLGKYMTVKVMPTTAANQKTSIFASIGIDTFEFQPNIPVSLPVKIIKLLKQAGSPVGQYDPDAESDNGNKGAHITVYIPKYAIEVITEELE